jgi:DNA-binding transcriptional regulator YiaG
MILSLTATAYPGDSVPNLAALLKVEIVRLAKKEVRVAVGPLKKLVSSLRNEVQAMKRERSSLQKEVARLSRGNPRPTVAEGSETVSSRARLTQAGIKTLRKRLGLSAAQLGLLVDASGQSVYKWEDGVHPRKPQMKKLIELRGVGKKQVKAMLESKAVKPSGSKVRKKPR